MSLVLGVPDGGEVELLPGAAHGAHEPGKQAQQRVERLLSVARLCEEHSHVTSETILVFWDPLSHCLQFRTTFLTKPPFLQGVSGLLRSWSWDKLTNI